MDPSLAIRNEVMRGERLIWHGAPKKGLMLRKSDWALIPFSLFFFGFSIFWMLMAGITTPQPFFALFGLPFFFVGLYLVLGRFFLDARRRANTYYGLTDSRIIIMSKGNVTSSHITKNMPLEVLFHKDGRATIIMGKKLMLNAQDLRSQHRMVSGPANDTTFEAVENGQMVYKYVRDVISDLP